MIRPNRIVQAIEQNQVRMWEMLATATGDGAFQVIRGVTVASVPVPVPLFNSVLACEIESGEEEEAIDGVSRFFASRNMPWQWTIGPSTRPAALADLLIRRGFTHSYDVPGMAIDLRSYRPPKVTDVLEVRGDDDLRLWLAMVDKGFGLPIDAARPFIQLHDRLGWSNIPLRYFYLLQNGEPAAFAMTSYLAGVAGIYCVATVPEARRQGLGEKVTHACLAGAAEDGYDVAILQSSKMGRPLYEKIGFKEYCTLSSYSPPVL